MSREFTVNSYQNEWQDQPVVAHFADGSFVVCWRSFHFDSSTYYLAAQRYDANGRPLGAELVLDAVAGSASEVSGISALADGGLAISFAYSDGGLLEPDEAWALVLNEDFSVRASAFQVAGPSANVFQILGSQVVPLANGGFLVAYAVDGTASNANLDFNDIFVRTYTAQGVAVGGPVRLNTNVAEFDQVYVDSTQLNNGEVLVTWHSEGSFPTPGVLDSNEIRGAIFDASGNVVKADFSIADVGGTVGDGADPYAVSHRTDVAGGFALATYETSLGTGGAPTTYDVNLQFFGNDGLADSNVLKVVRATEGIIYDIDATTLDTGEIVVTWEVPASPFLTYFHDVQARIFDAQGRAISGILKVAQYRVDDQKEPEIEALAGGGFVTVFTSEQADLDDDGIAGRIFGRGTSGSNTMTVDATNYLAGLGGRDTLTGKETRNHIYGGAGNDTMDGKGGNDLLSGGTGRDQFLFTSALNASSNVDRISDFQTSLDEFVLSQALFGSIGVDLSVDEFRLGSLALDENDYILYERSTGRLFYDADGNGTGGAILFADLKDGQALHHSDFLIA